MSQYFNSNDKDFEKYKNCLKEFDETNFTDLLSAMLDRNIGGNDRDHFSFIGSSNMYDLVRNSFNKKWKDVEFHTMFHVIFGGLDDKEEETVNPATGKLIATFEIKEDDLPHDTARCIVLFYMIMSKYVDCTEAERRQLVRSDAEFHEMAKEAIARRAGFRNAKECFGNKVPTKKVPRLPRGHELLFGSDGDVLSDLPTYQRKNEKRKRKR